MRIVFYGNSRGRLLALDWLQELRWREVYRYVRYAAVLRELGAQGRALGLPLVQHVADGIHVLRPLLRDRPVPLLTFFHEDDAVVLGPARPAREPLALATLVRACRNRRAYERDPLGRSHDGGRGAPGSSALALLDQLTGREPELRARIEEERLTVQVAQAAQLFRMRGGGSEDPLEFQTGLPRGTLAQLERGELGTQMVRRLQRIGWRLGFDVRLVLVSRPRNGRRKHAEDRLRPL